MRTVERPRDRRELVRDAGLRSTSLVSVLAGVLVAYGAVLVLLAVAAGIGDAVGVDTAALSDSEWRDLGTGAAVLLGVVLLAGYFFGGYVAGRMGRRAGVAHGLLVFVLGLAVIAAVAGITSATADGDAISDELRNQGIPTALDDWRDIGLVAGVGVLAAMLVGAVAGGVKGERWHGLLVSRALDPAVRPRGEASPAPADAASPSEETMTIPARGLGEDTLTTPARQEERTMTGRRSGTEDTVHLPDTGSQPPASGEDAGPTGPTRRPAGEEQTRVTRLQ